MHDFDGLSVISHLPPPYQSLLLTVEPYLGLPLDQVNLLFILIGQCLAGCVYRRLHGTQTRQIFGGVVGFVIMFAMYGIPETVGLLLFMLGMYPIVLLKNPRITFWIGMGVLFLAFLYMFTFHYLAWRLDLTMSLMGAVIRSHTLTWDLYDAQLLKNADGDTALGNFARFVAFRKEHAVPTQNFSFSLYLSYMLFFLHVLCGSNLTYNEYLWISDKSIYQRTGWKDADNDPQPSNKQVAMAVLKVAMVSVVYLLGKTYFSLDVLMTSEWQNNTPFWKQFWIVPLTSFLNKFKYHFAWKVLDLSMMTSGAGFSSVEYNADGTVRRTQWYRANNIRSLKTAFPQYTGDVVRNWNMTVNDWLTFYVFYRITSTPTWLRRLQGKKGSKVIVTRMASALWHGVYPSYYVFFFFTAVTTNVIDTLRLVLPTFEDEVDSKQQSKWALKSICLYIFWMLMVVVPTDSVGILFMELDIFKVLALFRAVYWFPFVILAFDLVLGQLLLRTIGMKPIEKAKRAKRKSAQQKKES
eukprot:CAMPEP_0202694682 /NCGR_PEP_ID=MMETSP1385-20130828/8482_1 /ASSEMBLY_ACC=CAM_ASM_000861 /TAXON_ID=933848 /ORGANISM="Elphidium margaritaceum" /LENGTH=522 /DNA_ID=CAMNT_0049350575 /DNA_START=20 /DNA_END=1588 /DNA_ORIENTATION=+